MTSTNGWLKKITSRAEVVRETAKTRIAQLTDTLDKKLKEAQDDLEKQRLKAEASRVEVPQQDIWRPSVENPDGQILTIARPPPIVLPTVPTLPEAPPTPSPPVEPLTIRHTKGRRRPRKNGFVSSPSSTIGPENELNDDQRSPHIKQRDHRMDVKLCLDALISEIIDREQTAACLNDLMDILAAVNELVESAVAIDASPKEKLMNRPETPTEIDPNVIMSSSNAPSQADIESTESIDALTSITPIHEDLANFTDSNDELIPILEIAVAKVEQTLSLNDTQTIPNVTDMMEELHSTDNDTVEDADSMDNTPAEVDDKDGENNLVDSETHELGEQAITQSDSHNLDTNEVKEDALISTNDDSLSVERTDSDDTVPSSTTHIEPVDPKTVLGSTTETTSATSSASVQLTTEYLDDDETKTGSVTSETSANELEEASDKMKTVSASQQQSAEELLQQSTSLAELRKFLLSIESDANTDEEPRPAPQAAQVTNASESKLREEKHTVISAEDVFLTSSSSHSVSMTTTTDNVPDSPSDDFFVNSIKAMAPSIVSEQTEVEMKRFPTVNWHSIPPATKVSHITCSSTYIYICTNDRKIFYAKFRSEDISLPFKWQLHSELAERLIVSVSNRTVWRLLNKQLYSSNDPIKFPPIGSTWNPVPLGTGLLSISINDQCGWYIKQDGSLWLTRMTNAADQPLNVTCPFNLNTVVCFAEKVGVTTSDGEILIRVGCTDDCPEGDGWIFIDHSFGPVDDFVLLTHHDTILIVDRSHHLWMQQWSARTGFFEVLCDDDCKLSRARYLTSANAECLFLTDCEEQVQIFSECITGFEWRLIEENTRLQRLIGAFADDDYVWTLTTNRTIQSSNGQILEKPRRAQYLTHATFVPNHAADSTVLWALDESCNIYVRPNLEVDTLWEQLDQSQFEWTRRLVHMVCNHAGVWAVDDRGLIYFRHGHISASQTVHTHELSILPPAWINIPGEAQKHRYFSQVFCGPVDWMVYATDNKQTVYARLGINDENRVGTSWKAIEDCSALELAISAHTLWLLTSCGEIQCRENISLLNPVGTRSVTLPGHFLSLTVSADDSQVWALNSQRNLLKLDRLTVLFEK